MRQIYKFFEDYSVIREIILGILAFLNLFFVLTFPATSNAQEYLPFEEKAKYERFLSQKLDEVLVKVLGPNQVKVIVDAQMDFTKTERVEYEKSKTPDFKLQGQAGDISGIEYLMPGFGLPSMGNSSNNSYSKQLIFPSNFVKKLKITVLVNKELDEITISNIKEIISQVLVLNNERGDEIVLVKSHFAPIWKTIWYNPESMNFVVKYIVLSILGVISMIIVAIGFIKIAGAMNTMAKVQQSHQITMELGNNSSSSTVAPAAYLSGLSVVKGSDDKKDDVDGNGDAKQRIYFNVLPHQIDALVNLMMKEDPANVAIVVNHLKEDIKNEFLSKLPLDFSCEVIAGLSKIRFIEQDAIYTLKDELETRLSGAIGGLEYTLSSFEKMDYSVKTKMIKTIESKHPDIAYEIRKRILIFEDIMLINSDELSLLVSLTQNDDWANLLISLDENFKAKVSKCFSQTAWKIIEEKNKYETPSQKKIDSAINNIMNVFSSLVEDGRIKRPLPAKTFDKNASNSNEVYITLQNNLVEESK